MSFNVQQLFLSKAARVNANPQSQEFVRAFLDALAETLASIRGLGFVSPTVPTSVDATISELDINYLPALSAGVDWHLHLRSEWSIDNPSMLQQAWEIQRRRTPFIYFNENAPEGRLGDTTA